MNLALRIYRRLARAFPHEFKLAFGTEVMELGDDIVEETAKRYGVIGLIRLIADLVIRLPIEYLSEMRRDLRYAARSLIKSPGFALVGILSMGLGIGLTTSTYSSKLELIFQRLPAAENAANLVMPVKPVSYYYIEQFRTQKGLFTGVAAVQTGIAFDVTFKDDPGARPERTFGQLVSPDYFTVLGVKPQRGRLLSPELDREGSDPVVVVSDQFWHRRLNSSPDAIGQTIFMNGQRATIVGITPAHFNGVLPLSPSELFVPVTVPVALAPELSGDILHQPSAKEFMALMCLAPGVTVESAEVGLDTIIRELDRQYSTTARDDDKSRRVTLVAAGNLVPVPRDLKPVLAGFFLVIIGLIMTIACMNLANMMLARGANRRKELAIRLAVGASRFRILRQMMTEGILLSMLGGIAGLALAYWIGGLQSHFGRPSPIPEVNGFGPDWSAAVFVFILVVLSGIGFGLAPALRVTRGDLSLALKEGSSLQLPGYRRFGLRNVLMVSQIVGSLMLLLITGFLVEGISRSSGIQTKFEPHTMGLLSIDPVRQGYSAEKSRDLFEKLPRRLAAVPGVHSVAMSAQSPFPLQDEDEMLQLTAEESRVQISAFELTVGAGYFAALNEPVLAGREFSDVDQRGKSDGTALLPAILNESAAHWFFGNEDPIGRRISDERQSYLVVGVVRDLKNGGLKSTVYLPLTARDFTSPPAGGITIMVRSDFGPDALNGVRHEIAAIDPNLTLFNVQTLNEYLDRTRSTERFAIATYAGIGLFGLILAAIGLAGVTAYTVAQRGKEIGIRMALGARTGQVLLLVLREGGILVTVGTVLGLLGAFVLAKLLATLMNFLVESLNVGTNDPRLILGAPLLMALVAILSCYLPARRAAKIDPLKSLRQE